MDIDACRFKGETFFALGMENDWRVSWVVYSSGD
jgi:hypothetical protein